MMKKIIISTILLLTCMLTHASKVLISGTAKDYANYEISIYGYNNHFTYTKTKLGSCIVDDNGFFKLYINIKHTQLISIPLEYYTGEMYVEMNKEYVIKLPTRKSLSKKDKLNPYFQSMEIFLGIENSTKEELNYKIKFFDEELYSFINKNHKRKNQNKFCREFIGKTEKKYSNAHGFFKNYIRYSLASVRYIFDNKAFYSIEKACFNNQKSLLYNPAYTSLYKKLYGNFLLGNFKRKNNKELTYAFKAKYKFAAIDKILSKYRQYSDPIFREMLIMTSIYDGYNRKLYPFETSLSIFREINKTTRNIYNKRLSAELIKNITKLHRAYPAPNFKIGDTKLSNFKGKYLYINFANTQSITCLQDFEEMAKLYEHFSKEIEFVSICSDIDMLKYKEFISNNKYKWIFIHAKSENKIYKDYNIKAFPTYCLLDSEGKILKANARSPKEQIEVDFSNILRNLIRKRSRVQ